MLPSITQLISDKHKLLVAGIVSSCSSQDLQGVVDDDAVVT